MNNNTVPIYDTSDEEQEGVVFREEEWIGIGKTYPKDTPNFISNAKRERAKVPPEKQSLLPHPSTTVLELLDFELPDQSNAFIDSNPAVWFSMEKPTTNIALLFQRPIPSAWFLNQLRNAFGQAWFNGCQSVLDRRSNDGARFPLYAIEFWVEMARVLEGKKTWEESWRWFRVEAEKAQMGGRTTDSEVAVQIDAVYNALKKLPWKKAMNIENAQATTLTLATFLGSRWLTDEHINMMVQHLSEKLTTTFPTKKIIIASLGFSYCIQQVDKLLNRPEKMWKRSLLSRFKQQIEENNIQELYFPLFINENHWICGRVSFKDLTVSYADSLAKFHHRPSAFHRHLMRWLKAAFKGLEFTSSWRSTFPHAEQKDSWSCGIITANTLEHNVFGEPIWTARTRSYERIKWFLRFAENWDGRSSTLPVIETKTPTHLLVELSTSIDMCSDHNVPDLQRRVIQQLQSEGSTAGISTSPATQPETSPMTEERSKDETSSNTSTDYSDSSSNSSDDDEDSFHSFPVPISTNPPSLPPRPFDPNSQAIPTSTPSLKRPRNDTAATGAMESDDDQASDEASGDEARRAKQKKRARKGEGKSQSAKNERAMREALKNNEYIPNETRVASFRSKIRAIDPQAGFREGKEAVGEAIYEAKCSRCAAWVPSKAGGRINRFENHWNSNCKTVSKRIQPEPDAKVPATTRLRATAVTDFFSRKQAKKGLLATRHQPATTNVPCPGLTQREDHRIPTYVTRTQTRSGGARAAHIIAMEKFGKMYSNLSEAEKKEVAKVEEAEKKWLIQPNLTRVVAVSCERHVAVTAPNRYVEPCMQCRQVLKLKSFKNALRKKPPKTPKGYRHVNHRFRDEVVGRLFALNLQLEDILSTDIHEPCIQIAKAFLDGRLQDDGVFGGIMAAIAERLDREVRGLGKTNLYYTPALYELCQIIRDISPQAYKALSKHLQLPAERGMRAKRAREPRFPMGITPETFKLAAQQLKDLGYSGPVALSCDDTKLLSAYRLYYDNENDCHYLVGGTQEPFKLRVSDPDQVQRVLQSSGSEKATKVRLWCLAIPSPKVTPIIVAAMPISDSMDVDNLFPLLKAVLDGLIDQGIRIVSYAADGTEVERKVQKRLLDLGDKVVYIISNPVPGRPDTKVEYTIYRGQAIAIVQDSKHALKTCRNNLFSGARMLTLGNYAPAYRRIRQILEEQGPIRKRDVEKVDRQDDNAATRLFSAGVLQHIVDHQGEESLGEIVYLFVFGELVDAVQNRSMKHADRIRIALRTRYFIDTWSAYLSVCQYPSHRHHLTREALDILDILIDSVISLPIIHRDHLSEPAPLLPWLNSTEPCEHVFGCARQVVKDFTFLDFIYMIPKLRIKLREAVLHSQTTDAKASAAGYNHTYFDTDGVNFAVLSHFPSDDEIRGSIASAASQEAESLLSLLGINSAQVYHLQTLSIFQEPRKKAAQTRNRPTMADAPPLAYLSTVPQPPTSTIPSISAWYDPDHTPGHVAVSIAPHHEDDSLESDWDSGTNSDFDRVSNHTSSSEDETGQVLQRLIEAEESPPPGRLQKIDDRMANLTYAALSVMTDDATRVFEFVETGDNVLSQAFEEDVRGVLDMKKSIFELRQDDIIVLPALNIADRHFGASHRRNLDVLVEIREKNQTRQARTGLRTRFSAMATPGCLQAEKAKQEIRREMELTLSEYQDVKGVGTGLVRAHRWQAFAQGGRGAGAYGLPAGNSANASVVATATASERQSKREQVFGKAGFHGEYLRWLSDARISQIRPLTLDDYGLVYTKHGLRVGRVHVLYSKTGGKHGNHAAITDSATISAVSYIGVQLFQRRANRNFSPIPNETLLLSTRHYGFLPPTQFLIVLRPSVIKHNDDGGINLDAESLGHFDNLSSMVKQLEMAMKLFKKRKETHKHTEFGEEE